VAFALDRLLVWMPSIEKWIMLSGLQRLSGVKPCAYSLITLARSPLGVALGGSADLQF
jgi:hypothetical protein